MVQVSNQQVAAQPGLNFADSTAVTRDQARAVFGQVMGFVALTLGFLALGAYIGRDLSGGWGILSFIASFGCIIGLNDFNRLRRSGQERAVPIAASNVFLFFLQPFGGSND